ncbi:MAG TPA: heparinase II/III family protein, partial [Armatimonadota bacterium]|nr:heparinase II/III family protein [Armatimonadota bacterium]
MRSAIISICLAVSLAAACQDAPAPVIVAACEDAGEWEGGTLGSDVTRAGEASVRWAHADADTLRLVDPPADWTICKSIRFWLHSEVNTGSAFMLIIRSENPDTEGMDYWMARLKLDFEGWRQIVLDRKSMGSARRPLGWDQIDGVYFAASGWENEPDPRAVAHIDQLELFDRVGPTLTDEQLLEALDLTLPGLEAARDAADAGDVAKAKSELAAYLRARTSAAWWFDPHEVDTGIRHNRDAADKTVRGEIRQIAIWHEFPGGKIDWFLNPTRVRDEIPFNPEWQWQCGRMGYWYELGRTYWATGEDVYAETFVDHLRSWVRDCPRPDSAGNTAGSAWRTIECGIRMGGSWPDAYHRFLHSPVFTDDDIILYLRSCIEHAEHLRRHPTGGNWLTMEMSGLY